MSSAFEGKILKRELTQKSGLHVRLNIFLCFHNSQFFTISLAAWIGTYGIDLHFPQ